MIEKVDYEWYIRSGAFFVSFFGALFQSAGIEAFSQVDCSTGFTRFTGLKYLFLRKIPVNLVNPVKI